MREQGGGIEGYVILPAGTEIPSATSEEDSAGVIKSRFPIVQKKVDQVVTGIATTLEFPIRFTQPGNARMRVRAKLVNESEDPVIQILLPDASGIDNQKSSLGVYNIKIVP